MYKKFALPMIIVLLVTLISACGPTPTAPPAPPPEKVEVTRVVEVEKTVQVEVEKIVEVTSTAAPEKLIKVFGAFATPIEEPWDGVIHAALNKAMDAGKIEYTYTENIGYSGDMERVLREVCDQQKPDLIMGDAFGNEEAVRRVAADFPEIAFAFGSGNGPTNPNVAVFDNWIHEPAYLLGMLAGGLTKSNKIGVVGGLPVPEVNRIVNAFIKGAKDVNPKVKVYVSFINSWFDPAAADRPAAVVAAKAAELFKNTRREIILMVLSLY